MFQWYRFHKSRNTSRHSQIRTAFLLFLQAVNQARGQEPKRGFQLRSAGADVRVLEKAQASAKEYLSRIGREQRVPGVPDDAKPIRVYAEVQAAADAAGGSGSRRTEKRHGYFLPRHCLVLARYRRGDCIKWLAVTPGQFERDAGGSGGTSIDSFWIDGGGKLRAQLQADYPDAGTYQPRRQFRAAAAGAAAPGTAAAAAAAGVAAAAAAGAGAAAAAAAAGAGQEAGSAMGPPQVGSLAQHQVGCTPHMHAVVVQTCCTCCGGSFSLS